MHDYIVSAQNNKQTWIMEEEEEEEDEEDGGDIDSDDESTELPSLSASSSMPCNIDDLPLVAEQIKLMGFKNECSSVSTCTGINVVDFNHCVKLFVHVGRVCCMCW